jgi:hypothetical protein
MMVRQLSGRLLAFGSFLVLGSVTMAVADSPVTVQITGQSLATLGSVRVGPYTALINGVSTQVISNDFAIELGNPSWSANVTNSLLANSGTKWQKQNLYDQAAWLTLKMLDPNVTCTYAKSNCKGDIQFAIWGLTTPSALLNLDSASNDYKNVTDWIKRAQNWYTTQSQTKSAVQIASQFSNFSIYSPTGPGLQRELFVVRTPEATTPVLLAVNLLGLMAVAFFFRRQLGFHAQA